MHAATPFASRLPSNAQHTHTHTPPLFCAKRELSGKSRLLCHQGSEEGFYPTHVLTEADAANYASTRRESSPATFWLHVVEITFVAVRGMAEHTVQVISRIMILLLRLTSCLHLALSQ